MGEESHWSSSVWDHVNHRVNCNTPHHTHTQLKQSFEAWWWDRHNSHRVEKVSMILFTIKTMCTAELKPTVLSSYSKLKCYNTSSIPLCISNSSYHLMDDSCKHGFILSTCHIFIDIYLHSLFLESIEKINSIAFVVTIFITLCILVDNKAKVQVACLWRFGCIWKEDGDSFERPGSFHCSWP